MAGVISPAGDKGNENPRTMIIYYVQDIIMYSRCPGLPVRYRCKLLKPDGFGGSDSGDQIGGPDHHQ